MIEVRNSVIHSNGVFATEFIPKDTQVIQYLGEIISKEESEKRALAWEEHARTKGFGLVYIFELNETHDIDGNMENNPAKFINHSCEPNCESVNIDDEIWVIATRDISPGEEITYDYGYDIEHFMDHKCLCNAPSCVGYIVRKDQRRKLKRILHLRFQKKHHKLTGI